MAKPDTDLIAKLNACTEHARELVTAAKAVLASGQHNIAYHLAVLALEETGKRELIAAESVADDREIPPTWPGKQLLDHRQKLFWCFFGASMVRHNVTKEDFDKAKLLSQSLHFKRMAGLYVDSNEDGVSIPKLAIDPKEAEEVVGLADTRVKMAASLIPRDDVPEEEIENQRWFLNASEDPELRQLMFSKGSMNKLSELDDINGWVKWLRGIVEDTKAAGAAAVKAELERSKNLPREGTRIKWKVRFRLQSASHSIRPNALTDWNNSFTILKLSPVSGKKRELIVEVMLQDHVPLEAVFHFAWGIARQFTVALNIATLGFWWWDFPQDQTKWYERIDDLDNPNMEVRPEQPERKIDWGDGRVIKADDMQRVKLTFVALTAPPEPISPAAMNEYISGLSYLAASDIHVPQEGPAMSHFVAALQMMMEQRGDYIDGEPFEPAFTKFLASKEVTIAEAADVTAIVRAVDESKRTGQRVSGPYPKMQYVAVMKAIVDWYFLGVEQPWALKHLEELTAKKNAIVAAAEGEAKSDAEAAQADDAQAPSSGDNTADDH